MLALDGAATEFYKNGKYVIAGEGKTLGSDEMAAYLADLVDRYPIFSIEDGMGEDDWDGWKALTDLIGDRCQLVGDDLFVTNRSEEHTSELQSLMRISYAVFCLKKKKKNSTKQQDGRQRSAQCITKI